MTFNMLAFVILLYVENGSDCFVLFFLNAL